jgi:hypothetical protein
MAMAQPSRNVDLATCIDVYMSPLVNVFTNKVTTKWTLLVDSEFAIIH